MTGVLPIRFAYFVICVETAKRTHSLIAKNEPDRNWRLSIKENWQKLYSKWFEMLKQAFSRFYNELNIHHINPTNCLSAV